MKAGVDFMSNIDKNNKMENFECLETKTIYEGKLFNVEHRRLRLPDGKEAQWDMVKHNGAAAVLPITNDGKLLLVRQYREGAKAITLELPAGKLDPGEDPETCALREMEEETGWRAEKIKFLMRLHPASAYLSEVIHIYLAEGLKPGKVNLDADEFVTIETHSLADVLQMIDDGEITDSKTLAGVLYYARLCYHTSGLQGGND